MRFVWSEGQVAIGDRQEGRMNRIIAFLADEQGVTIIEYAFMALLIALAVIGLVQAIGIKLQEPFVTVNSALSGS